MRLIVLIFIICIFIIILFNIYNKNMTYIKSDIDNRYYLVRNLYDKQIACNILAYNREKIIKLIEYLKLNKNKYKDFELNIDRLNKKIENLTISENNDNNNDTSYSINKGDELVVCLRSKINWNNFHDLNMIFYVILHELSHIASPEYEEEYNNHGPIFKKIFTFLTNIAIENNLYIKIDFNKEPREYCGMYITYSII
jgi:hypothetical protein